MRHANAASLLGDEAAFRSAITRARRELDRDTRADDPEWIQFVDETEITGHEAMGVLNHGKPGRGETLYRTVLDGNLTRLNRTFYGALLSGALLQQHAREHAIAEGMSVLPALADGVTSVRRLNELRPLRAVDGLHTEERAAFCEQFDAVARSLASLWLPWAILRPRACRSAALTGLLLAASATRFCTFITTPMRQPSNPATLSRRRKHSSSASTPIPLVIGSTSLSPILATSRPGRPGAGRYARQTADGGPG